jgi:putative ABC transport system substrate-binding protein
MRRRIFLGLLGGAIGWPLTARADEWEPGRVYRIGFLLPTPRKEPVVAALFDELRIHGLIEGKNLLVLGDGFGTPFDQAPKVAAALVAASPDVIVSGPELPIRAVQKLTQTIPLIGMTEDMVGEGLVQSLARPGGNTTGISLLSPELDGKRHEILMEAIPGLHKLAIFADANSTKPAHLKQLEEAAHSHGLEPLVRAVAKRDDVIEAIKDVKVAGAQAINFLATPLFSVNALNFIAQVRELQLASIYQWPEDAEEGGFSAYGPRYSEMYRLRARLVMKVLQGTSPADIPVQQPTKFELVVNLKTAKAIGVDVPNSLLLRADKVIEYTEAARGRGLRPAGPLPRRFHAWRSFRVSAAHIERQTFCRFRRNDRRRASAALRCRLRARQRLGRAAGAWADAARPVRARRGAAQRRADRIHDRHARQRSALQAAGLYGRYGHPAIHRHRRRAEG